MIEKRFLELRSEVTGNRLTGYASTFGTYANIGPYYETMTRTAFDAVLADPLTDARAFLDHDPGKLLGRQSSGTLRLSADSTGLLFALDLPDTSAARDPRELISRGDLTGVSIGFQAGVEDWQTYEGRDLRVHRSIARLVEISPVAIPAYPGTSVALRSKPAQTASGRTQLVRAELAHYLTDRNK